MKQLIAIFSVVIFTACGTTSSQESVSDGNNDAAVVDGIHVQSGLKANDGYLLVQANCTPCHSAKLITQNRATRDGWLSMIRWMQKKQNLWELGENEDKILDYLAANYAPENKGRRENLRDIEWYNLED